MRCPMMQKRALEQNFFVNVMSFGTAEKHTTSFAEYEVRQRTTDFLFEV